MCVCVSDDEDTEDRGGGGGGDKLVDGMAPTPEQRKLARQDGLRKAKSTGKYPEFKGVVGAADKVNPSNTIDFVKLLWPDSLCEHIAEQTNLYATQCGAKSWKGTHRDEIWVFIGIILEMGIHRLPEYTDYWYTNRLIASNCHCILDTIVLASCLNICSIYMKIQILLNHFNYCGNKCYYRLL